MRCARFNRKERPHFRARSQNPAVNNPNGLLHCPRRGTARFHFSNYVHSVTYAAEDDVLSVQKRLWSSTYEKLRAVRVLSRVCHGDSAGAAMTDSKILILERTTVNRVAARSVPFFEITPLNHESGNDSMKGRPSIMTLTEGSKIFRRSRCHSVE